MDTIKLEYIGMDSWNRPVYKDENGRLWKDVDPRQHRKVDLCTANNNEFNGEPDVPMSYMSKYKDIKMKFIPERVTW